MRRRRRKRGEGGKGGLVSSRGLQAWREGLDFFDVTSQKVYIVRSYLNMHEIMYEQVSWVNFGSKKFGPSKLLPRTNLEKNEEKELGTC